jgi:tripartite-type tricarboxylate transporter receptor subunit TctC
MKNMLARLLSSLVVSTLGVCALLPVLAGLSYAQTAEPGYPTRSVRVLVPYPAGGPTDLIARFAAQKLSEKLGQQFYVENVSGASGARGAAMAAAAQGDGYTLMVVTNDLAITPVISKNVQYDAIRSFVPISIISASPSVVLVHPSVPAKTLKEFVDLARADPAKYSFAAMSLGQNLLTSERLFRLGLKLSILRVPFPGAAPILTSTVAGHTLVAYIGLPAATPFIKEGKLRALAVTSPKRSPIVPDVPTMTESGFSNLDSEFIIGVVAPAATPKAIVDLLSTELAAIVAQPDTPARLLAFGFVPVGSTPEEFGAQIKSDIDTWTAVVRDAGIKIE